MEVELFACVEFTFMGLDVSQTIKHILTVDSEDLGSKTLYTCKGYIRYTLESWVPHGPSVDGQEYQICGRVVVHVEFCLKMLLFNINIKLR